MLVYLDRGYSIENILYYVGALLLGNSLAESVGYKSDLEFTIPDETKKEHDLLGSIYRYLSPKSKRLSLGSFYTSESMIENIVKDIPITSKDLIVAPSCCSGTLLLNSKVTNPKQTVGIDIDPVAIMCCKFNYYMKFGKDAPTPQIYCKDFLSI